MEASMGRLLALIDDVHKYVDDVVEGRLPQDNKTGRFIADTVATIPKLSPQAFDKLVNDGLQVVFSPCYVYAVASLPLFLNQKVGPIAFAVFGKPHEDSTQLCRKVEYCCSDPVIDDHFVLL
ncbi:hypothetical protein K7X08_030382 [Anisodus acutangulus]|uniref:EIF3F/CSN6-like C-terminal domain-containing protein n=1 Tax=Anisodus acutangulus TaxID=402998 RepID=A0A9Q1LQX4_9SOLA|nr:hypothetical protein K7X08_030382 [Anisodus acutangulus]